jgi:hypothetical protein
MVGVLVGLMLPVIAGGRSAAQSAQCLAHLRQVSAGLLQYASDHDKQFPDPFAAQTSWEQLLRVYLKDGALFRCPADRELFELLGSSFDWRDTGMPETTLAGRLVTDTSRPDCVLVFEAMPGWHARGRMNAALLNGAAVSMEQDQCLADIRLPIRAVGPGAADARRRRARG